MRHVLAGALTGLAAGAYARSGQDKEGAGGRPDPALAFARGAQAGGALIPDKTAALQKQADAATQNKLLTVKANLDLYKQQMANYHAGHDQQDLLEKNNAGLMNDAAAFDSSLSDADKNDATKRAITKTGLTHDQALTELGGQGLFDKLAFVTGHKDVQVDGKWEVVPLFSILNPNLTTQMSEAQAAQMATFNPAYKNAYNATGGDLRIPLSRYAADQHQLNELNQTEAFFKGVQDQLGLKNVPDFSALARDPQTGRQVRDAVADVTDARSKGGTPIDALRRLTMSGGGALILKGMGIDNATVTTAFNKQVADQKSAEAEGKKEVKETPTPKSAADLEHTQLENKVLQNKLSTDAKIGDTTKTGDEYIKTLSPQDQAQLKAVHEGRQGLSERQLGTKDGKILSEQLNAAYPDFDASKYPNYNKMRGDMTSGKASVGINRFNTALRHLDTMNNHVNAWSTLPGLSTLSALSGGDAANLEADRTAVASELAAAYKGGVASQAEVNEWNEMLNSSSPARLHTNIKEIATLLRGKLDAYQNQWDNGAPRDVVSPIRIISNEGRAAYKNITGEKIPPARGDMQTNPANGFLYRFDGTNYVNTGKKAGQ
jgi:hypothetical protein